MQKQKSEQELRAASGSGSTCTDKSANDSKMIHLYKVEKKTLREVAAALGVSHVTVMNRLKRLKVEMRPSGRTCEMEWERLRKLSKTDATLSEMGFLLGCAPSTVGKALIKLKEKDLAESATNQPA